MRRRLRATIWTVATAALGAAGCLRTTSFHCDQDADCARGAIGGRCEPTNFCSFADPTCAGLGDNRYDSSAGRYANVCVGAISDVDGGVDATADASPDAGLCPSEKIPPCHPTGGSGSVCDPIRLTEVDATYTLGMVMIGDTLHFAGGDGQIHRISYTGAVDTTIVGDGGDSVALTADATHIYWNDYNDPKIRGAALVDPFTTYTVTSLTSSPYFGRMQVVGDTLFFVGNDAVYAAAADGSQPVPTKIVSKVSDSNNPDAPAGVAFDGTDVYFTDTGKVRKIALADAGNDTAAVDVATSAGPTEVAVDATRVYWTGEAGLSWRNKDGSGLTTIPVNDVRTRGLLLDGDYVYTTTPDGRILRIIKGGAPADLQVVAHGIPDAYELAADCGAIYWGTFLFGNHGTVFKVRKP